MLVIIGKVVTYTEGDFGEKQCIFRRKEERRKINVRKSGELSNSTSEGGEQLGTRLNRDEWEKIRVRFLARSSPLR